MWIRRDLFFKTYKLFLDMLYFFNTLDDVKINKRVKLQLTALRDTQEIEITLYLFFLRSIAAQWAKL